VVVGWSAGAMAECGRGSASSAQLFNRDEAVQTNIVSVSDSSSVCSSDVTVVAGGGTVNRCM
jgi:hypothetical protein